MARVGTVLLTATLIAIGSDFAAQSPAPPTQKRPDAPQLAPYVPTPQDVVDRMLKLAGVAKGGCRAGPRLWGRANPHHGRKGVRRQGHWRRYRPPSALPEANANAKAAGVTDLVEFRLQDAMTTDVSQATVITLYLLSSSNLKLRPILTRKMKPGTRLVAHNFAMGDWEAETIDTFTDQAGRSRSLYRWTFDGKVRQ